MQVSKKTLYILCPVVLVVIAMGCILYYNYQEKQSKERDKHELQASFRRAWDKEYENQLRDYESLVRTIKDRDYSYEFRFKYVMKLNELLGIWQYRNTGLEYSTVDECLDNLRLNEEDDKELLRQKAYKITYNRFLGIDDNN